MTSSSTDPKEIRKFGAVALIFFGLLASVGFYKDKTFITCFFGTLASLGLGFLIIPVVLAPVYRGWLKIAHFIGKTITTLTLVLAYYLVITPSALIKRIFGGAPLALKPDKDADTYWVTRDEPAQPKERFGNRF